MVKRKIWIEMSIENVPSNANISEDRFVLSIKYHGTQKYIWEATFVVQVHKNSEKNTQVHSITVTKLQSVHNLVGLAFQFGFKLFSTDVTQAYLQSAENLQREIYVKSCKEFGLKI